jgi:hypothetical protein
MAGRLIGEPTEMQDKIRTIDPRQNLGLHELANSGGERDSFRFQLAAAKEQTENILSNLDNLVENTRDKAPSRTKDFCLDRVTDPDLTDEEDKWERAMYKKWGPKGSGEFVPFCKRIQTYQYPLREHGKENRRWGAIDLLGIGTDFLPVPIELKKREADDSPLRMLVEVAAYGFAISKVWPNLKDYWGEAVRRFEGSPLDFPATLGEVTLVGVAPDAYWCQCLGLLPQTKKGEFPPPAWTPFWKLIDALRKWFNIRFVAVEGIWNNEDSGRSPTITGAREIDLRSLTPDPAADASAQRLARASRDALLEAYQKTVHHSPSFRR